jgi:hypothetical protein
MVLPVMPEPGEQVACPAPACLYWAAVVEVDRDYLIQTRCPQGHERLISLYSVVKFDNPELTRARPG